MAAEAREFRGLKRRCHKVERLGWPLRFACSAWLGGRKLLLVANGAGPRLAGEACETAWARQRADAMVSAGYCGALDGSLRLGDVFVATSVETPGRPLRFEPRRPVCARRFAQGRLFSVDRVVGTAQEKMKLRAMGAAAVEMEAAAVGWRSRHWGVPFYCIRAVTDLAAESFCLDLNAARDPEGRIRQTRLVGAALRRPSPGLSELYRLWRRSRIASMALGEFLADCEFEF